MVPTRVPPSFALSRSLQHSHSPVDPVCSGGYGCGSGAAGDSCITLSLLSTQQPGLTGPPPPLSPSLPLPLFPSLSVFFFFFETGFFWFVFGFLFFVFYSPGCLLCNSLYRPGWPGSTSADQKSACLCFPSAGDKGVCVTTPSLTVLTPETATSALCFLLSCTVVLKSSPGPSLYLQ